jgi:hypothetical protein
VAAEVAAAAEAAAKAAANRSSAPEPGSIVPPATDADAD